MSDVSTEPKDVKSHTFKYSDVFHHHKTFQRTEICDSAEQELRRRRWVVVKSFLTELPCPSHRYWRAVSSSVQKLSCTRSVPESKSSAGALLASSLFLRFFARRLVLGCIWRRDGNWLPGDRVVEAGRWVWFVVGIWEKMNKSIVKCDCFPLQYNPLHTDLMNYKASLNPKRRKHS